MNIFNELKKYILPYYPIFEYKGQEIYNGSYNIVVFLTICISYANNCFTL